MNYWKADALLKAVKHVLEASEDGGGMSDIDFNMLREAVTSAEEPQSDRDKRIIAMAKEEHQKDGEVEVDDNAVVSESGEDGDNGAYVGAWVWVGFGDTEFDKEKE